MLTDRQEKARRKIMEGCQREIVALTVDMAHETDEDWLMIYGHHLELNQAIVVALASRDIPRAIALSAVLEKSIEAAFKYEEADLSLKPSNSPKDEGRGSVR